MITILKVTIFIVIQLFFNWPIHAQKTEDCTSINIDSLYNVNKEKYIPIHLLLGDWISNDTLGYQMTFKASQNSLIILPNHYVNPFSFPIVNDSIPSSGSAMNWPPTYCTFQFLADSTLKMYYFDFTRENTICYCYAKK